jgi:hypothetical protein
MATAQSTAVLLSPTLKSNKKRPSQDAIRKALEAAGLSASQADDAAIYATHRVRTEAGPYDGRFWTMKQLALATIEHLRNQQVPVPEVPDYKLNSVIAGLLDEWDDLIPVESSPRVGGAA